MFFCLLLASVLQAQQPSYEWVKTFGGTGGDHGSAITVDDSGNIYTTGGFSGTVDFDPGSGTDYHTSVGGAGNSFIQKLDINGNFLWAKTFGEYSSHANILSITVDNSGNIYTTGYFRGTVDFDPGNGTDNHTSAGSDDVFIQKLDSNGNFLWTKTFGGSYDDFCYSITTDTSGNIYTTGSFWNTVDFDPGSGIDNHTSAGSDDVFIQKLDSNGNFLWAKTFGGISGASGRSINIDDSGNIYTTGIFFYTVDFDPGSGTDNHTSVGSADVFIQKLDSNGNFLWAKTFGGTDSEHSNSITVDTSGNIYTAGYFEGQANFDPEGGNVISMSYQEDVFIHKLDANGNFLWVRTFGGMGEDMAYSITVDASDDIYVTGCFSSTVSFPLVSGPETHTSAGNTDVFVTKLDTNGYFQWAKSFGGTNYDRGFSITVDASGNIYSLGGFGDTVDFDPSNGTDNHTTEGSFDIFIHKLSQLTTTTSENDFDSQLIIYPNPNKGHIIVELGNAYETAEISIIDITGKIIYENTLTKTIATTIYLDEFPAGVYFINIQSKRKRKSIKIIKE